MAKMMTKTQVAGHIATKFEISKKQSTQILEELATLAAKQAKNGFVVPGVGKLVEPGTAAGVGEWAVNPLSRRMMLEAAKEVFALRCLPWTLTITLSIPDGVVQGRKRPGTQPEIVGGLEVRHGA